MELFTKDFIERQRQWLIVRRESKTKILMNGGLLASLHSPNDIAQIDIALERIKKDQYGLCVGCGHLIEKERLEFKPEILFCIDCQIDKEKKEKISP